jgi:glucose-6-phosphate isomerase
MTLDRINPINTKSWKKLKSLNSEIDLKSLFKKDKLRSEKYSINFENLFVDFSKNLVSDEILRNLFNLSRECKLEDCIAKQFNGDKINETEDRQVLHTALRSYDKNTPFFENIKNDREKIKDFSDGIINGKLLSCKGERFTDIVNIGIGGSDLGPQLVIESLKFYKTHLNIHFVSNVDGDHVNEVLKNLNPETTFFIIVSKTFTTQETITNALTIKEWFCKNLDDKDIQSHFAAVSTNLVAIKDFGINPNFVFPMYDFVGGRFSLWGTVGVSISLAIGYENFEKLLKGANTMDQHFKNEPLEKNIPIILALISIWNNNFLNAESEAVIPYSEYLKYLPSYLQQASMESNGKSIDRNGKRVKYQTGNIIWGGSGTNSQHAFFQLIHQGTKLIPCDFIGFKKSLYGNEDHNNKLLSNFIGQTEALLNGRELEDVRNEMLESEKSNKKINEIAPFKVFEGNKPSTSILFDSLTPKSLGMMISMYEHKIFTQGIIWNIFSYDQWGVELGKKLATKLLTEIETGKINNHDNSTTFLLKKTRINNK